MINQSASLYCNCDVNFQVFIRVKVLDSRNSENKVADGYMQKGKDLGAKNFRKTENCQKRIGKTRRCS